MKRTLALIVSVLLLPLASQAEPAQSATANGVVKANDTYEVTAPFSGTLLPFTLEKGDEIPAGEILFTLDTLKVYAPEDGKVTLFAAPGDSAEDVIRQYGMLAAIEKPARYRIDASTKGAYNAIENKFVSLGETLYFHLISDGSEEGEGRVVAVHDASYEAEILRGTFELGKKVKLYREEGKSNASCVGEGTIVRAPEIAVLGSGRVLRRPVENGQQVQKGDLLFELAAADCPAGVLSESIPAPREGVLETPKVVSGQQVYKGQALATLHDTSSLKVVAEVDEIDLPRLQVGSAVTLAFDAFPAQRVPGTVTRISRMGIPKQNAAYFDVDIAFASNLDIRLFMNATVTLP